MTPVHRELDQAISQLKGMYDALAHLKDRTGGGCQFLLLSEGPLDEIRRLERTISELSGRSLAEQQEAEVWMQVEGADVHWPEAPTSILTNLLDALRKGVQAAAEWLLKAELSTRPTKDLRQACDLSVVAVEPGSVRIGLRLPDAGDGVPQPVADAAQDALANYVSIAAWAASQAPHGALTALVQDPSLQRILLTEVKRLVPRPRGGVDSVLLYGRALRGQPQVRLTRELHARIDSAIDTVVTEKVERYEGDVREIDLDNSTFTLRNLDGLAQVPCEFEPDLYDSALDALGRRVEVTGVRRLGGSRGRAGRLFVTRLVILDEPADAWQG